MPAFALVLLRMAPMVLSLGQEVVDMLGWGADVIEKRTAEGLTEPTAEDWAELNKRRDALTARLNADPA